MGNVSARFLDGSAERTRTVFLNLRSCDHVAEAGRIVPASEKCVTVVESTTLVHVSIAIHARDAAGRLTRDRIFDSVVRDFIDPGVAARRLSGARIGMRKGRAIDRHTEWVEPRSLGAGSSVGPERRPTRLGGLGTAAICSWSGT
jgi:hypothetical protein